MSKKWKLHTKGKGKKKARVAAVGVQSYTPIKVPLSRDAYLQAMVVGSEATNSVLSSSLCANPILPLAATLAIFKATLDSPLVALKDNA